MRNVFSQRMRGCRANQGLSQTELANKVGVSLRTVQNWEKEGSEPPKGRNLRKLGEVFGVAISYLMGEESGFHGPSTSTELIRDSGMPTKQQCREHLERVLDACGDDISRIGWVLEELREQLPLNKWRNQGPVNYKAKTSSAPDDVATKALEAGVAEAERQSSESRRLPEAGGTNEKTSSPNKGAGKH